MPVPHDTARGGKKLSAEQRDPPVYPRDGQPERQIGTHHRPRYSAPEGAPWKGTDREVDKTRLYEYARRKPAGSVLSKVVRDLFGRTAVSTAGADYKLAKRFYERHDMFEMHKRGGVLWVWPTARVFYLTPSKQTVGNAEGVGVGGTSAPRGGGGAGAAPDGPGGDGSPSGVYPKGERQTRRDADEGEAEQRARALLERLPAVTDDSVRADLLSALAAKRLATDGRFNYFRRADAGESTGDEYLAVPYVDRFNSERRVGENADRLREAFVQANRKGCKRGVLLTLTTDPSNVEHLLAGAESILADKNKLNDRLDYDAKQGPARPGTVPPHVTVPEFTDSGLAHVHVVYFGAAWLMPQAALSRLWSDVRGAEVVDVRQVRRSGGSGADAWRFAGAPPSDASSRSVHTYLGKTLRSARSFARASADEAFEEADGLRANARGERTEPADPRDWWKLALYWASGLSFVTVSPSLRSEPRGSGGEDGEDGPTWEYLGTARLQEIPGFMRDRMHVVAPAPQWAAHA